MGLSSEAIELYDRHLIAVDFFKLHLVFLLVYFLGCYNSANAGRISTMKRWSRASSGERRHALDHPEVGNRAG